MNQKNINPNLKKYHNDKYEKKIILTLNTKKVSRTSSLFASSRYVQMISSERFS